MARPRPLAAPTTIAALIVPLLAVLVTGCAASPEPAAAPRAGPPARNAATAPLLPTTTDALPDIDPAGFQTLLGQLRGTPVIVNVWGSWCAPCRDEGPELREAAARYGDRIQFLGVDILDERSSAAGFIAEMGWTYPSVFDPPGAVRDSLGFTGQPVTLFYDAGGGLVRERQGAIPPDELAAGIRALLSTA